jgi:fructose-bisphosphate aldolase, class II
MTSNKPPLPVPSLLRTTSEQCPRSMTCTPRLCVHNCLALLTCGSVDSPVVLHSDHCAEKLLPWFDGMLDADEEYYETHQEPLFSSHMLDLSEESKERNIATCVKYFKRMAPLGIWLEMEIGITGGEEDGVDNTGVDNSSLYTQPEDVYDIYAALSAISPNFSIAAAFGNVHGVYKPGNVRLHPELLAKHQAYAKGKIGGKIDLPL